MHTQGGEQNIAKIAEYGEKRERGTPKNEGNRQNAS